MRMKSWKRTIGRMRSSRRSWPTGRCWATSQSSPICPTQPPARADQERIIQALKQGSSGPFSLQRIERTFEAALAENGFREGIYANYLKTLPATLNPPRPVALEDLQKARLDPFVSRYVNLEPGDVRPVTYFFPSTVC